MQQFIMSAKCIITFPQSIER